MQLEWYTLTGVWTGGGESGVVDRIHESGIMGSLRWWYETLLRGMGADVCDPVDSRSSCMYDTKKHRASSKSDEHTRLSSAGLCDACQIFGATGWKRRFLMRIHDATRPDSAWQNRITARRSYKNHSGTSCTPSWYFKHRPRHGRFTVHLHDRSASRYSEAIAGLIQFVSDWSAIGARVQLGFGVIRALNGRIDTKALYDDLVSRSGTRTYATLPSLRNIFLARIRPKPSQASFTVQTTFDLKYDLRRVFASDRDIRHFISGSIKSDRLASKIKISQPYDDNTIRVWGWIPERSRSASARYERERVANALFHHLSEHYVLETWREMNSSRDTVQKHSSNARTFLSSLLALEEHR